MSGKNGFAERSKILAG